jgi:Glycosyltransferase Family 4
MEFAPVNTTGNFRSLKFVKYLHQFNVNPIVITFKELEGAEYFRSKIDNSLLKDIPDGLSIYRIHCDDGKKYYRNRLTSFLTIYFSIKDTFAKRWEKHLFKELDQIIHRHRPKVIYTSLPPFSSGMLAVKISKKFQLPLVVDMRDLYARWGNTPFGSRIHYWLARQEERRIFNHASAIIGVTPQLIKIFTSLHPSIGAKKFALITNGFDREEQSLPDISFEANRRQVIIGYVGSFYYQPKARDLIFTAWWKRSGHRKLNYAHTKEDWLYRSPYFFLKTIAELLAVQPQYREIVTIEFIGYVPDWLPPMIKNFGLQEIVTLHGFVSHEKAKLIQEHFDLMLATSEKVIGEEHYSLPSKIFDYVIHSKPVLGFVTSGIQKDFIEESGIGIICDPDRSADSAQLIANLLKNGRRFIINNQYLESYKRRNLAHQLAILLHKI